MRFQSPKIYGSFVGFKGGFRLYNTQPKHFSNYIMDRTVQINGVQILPLSWDAQIFDVYTLHHKK
jgi:hypothetical protein